MTAAGKVLCFDMDGVLSNFYPGYNAICKRLGKPILEPGKWDDFLVPEVWTEIKKSRFFWQDLPAQVKPEVFTRIEELTGAGAVVYFVSNRPGIEAGDQTRRWLEVRGIYRPNIIISKFKGEVAKAVGATHFLEDKAENAWCVAWLSPGTKSYLLDRNYNRYDAAQFGSKKVQRIFSVEEFLDIVDQEIQ